VCGECANQPNCSVASPWLLLTTGTSDYPGEEVAQRANVSATWYTWLEQGAAARLRPMYSIGSLVL
jgi:transcriptional regulator with XRE-family HTH domain